MAARMPFPCVLGVPWMASYAVVLAIICLQHAVWWTTYVHIYRQAAFVYKPKQSVTGAWKHCFVLIYWWVGCVLLCHSLTAQNRRRDVRFCFGKVRPHAPGVWEVVRRWSWWQGVSVGNTAHNFIVCFKYTSEVSRSMHCAVLSKQTPRGVVIVFISHLQAILMLYTDSWLFSASPAIDSTWKNHWCFFILRIIRSSARRREWGINSVCAHYLKRSCVCGCACW